MEPLKYTASPYVLPKQRIEVLMEQVASEVGMMQPMTMSVIADRMPQEQRDAIRKIRMAIEINEAWGGDQ
jgi:hypothetical protein